MLSKRRGMLIAAAMVIVLSMGAISLAACNSDTKVDNTNPEQDEPSGNNPDGSTHTHSYGDEWHYNSTDHWKECECGAKTEEAKHSLEYKQDGAAHYQECSICGYKSEPETHTLKYTQIADDNTNHQVSCDLCGWEDTESHNFDMLTIEPTCTEGGYTEYICSDCGYTYQTNQTNALGHTYSTEWISDDPDGHYHVCTTCGAMEETSKISHTYSSYVSDQESGHHQVCSECGYVTEEENHNFGAYVSDSDEGHHRICSDCSYSTGIESHSLTVIEEIVDNDTNHKVSCSECNYEKEEAHTYVDVVTAPTCDSEGYTTHTCSECGHVSITDKVEALGHQYSETLSCDETSHYYECERCGDKKDVEEHTFAHGYLESTSPDDETGEVTYVCTACGYTKVVTEELHFSSDDWTTINEYSASGQADERYYLGEQKTIHLDDEFNENITVGIIGFDADNLSDEVEGQDSSTNDGKAGITVEMVQETWSDSEQMNEDNTTAGGWASCYMKTKNLVDYFGYLPEELQGVIKTVDKVGLSGNGQTTTTTSENQLFLLAVADIWSETAITNSGNSSVKSNAEAYLQEGSQYEYYTDVIGDTDPNSSCTALVKSCPGVTDNKGNAYKISWWLRSPAFSNVKYFHTIGSSGSISVNSADGAWPISFAFAV